MVRDVWSVILGFLEEHSMEAAAGCRKDLGVFFFFARCAWVPLHKRRYFFFAKREVARTSHSKSCLTPKAKEKKNQPRH